MLNVAFLRSNPALLKEWWDMTPTGQLRTWGQPSPPPFKETKISPLRSIPGASSAETIKPDATHCFHIGIGGDLAASTLMGLCRMKVFGAQRKFQCRMNHAYDLFGRWCYKNHKTSTFQSFDVKNFKYKTYLDEFGATLSFVWGLGMKSSVVAFELFQIPQERIRHMQPVQGSKWHQNQPHV